LDGAIFEEWIEGDTVLDYVGDRVMSAYHLEQITEAWIRAGWYLSTSQRFDTFLKKLDPGRIIIREKDSALQEFFINLEGELGATPAETVYLLKKHYVDGEDLLSVRADEESQSLTPILKGIKNSLYVSISRKFLFDVLLNPTPDLIESEAISNIERFIIKGYSLIGSPISYIEGHVLRKFLDANEKVTTRSLLEEVKNPNIMSLESFRSLLFFFRRHEGKSVDEIREAWKDFLGEDLIHDKSQEDLEVIFKVVVGEEEDFLDMDTAIRNMNYVRDAVEEAISEGQVEKDHAQLSSEWHKGGIDFNSKELTLNIQSDEGMGKFNLVPQYLQSITIDKIVPVIVDITPLDSASIYLQYSN